MNKGIRASSGDVVGFINSDDVYASTSAIKRVAKEFKDPSVMGCYGDLCYLDKKEGSRLVRYWKSSQFVPRLFLDGWSPPHPTFFVRRSVYDHYGGFDLRYRIAADVELMIRFLEKYSIHVVYIPEILVNMRLGGRTNESLKNVILQNKEIWNALKQHDLNPSIYRFFFQKLISRCKQFITTP